ncbi:hypothetical protein Dalk_4606 [Desulfatibacillum aliphaticivorans]|uniref:Uncharacterized protein n=1 Tax=Desulfatibacillum aliphaticivorans TaxID=218208 RepID=B8FNK3_DESAL|nr:hypothetical protein Dalk_4606 [Desulfatibacillum aliphaticivorans]
MIRHPKPGQAVELHYRQSLRQLTGLHLICGSVVTSGKGPGPRNALVDLGHKKVVVPCGQLFRRVVS